MILTADALGIWRLAKCCAEITEDGRTERIAERIDNTLRRMTGKTKRVRGIARVDREVRTVSCSVHGLLCSSVAPWLRGSVLAVDSGVRTWIVTASEHKRDKRTACIVCVFCRNALSAVRGRSLPY